MKVGWDIFVDMDQVSEKYEKVCEVFPVSAVLHQQRYQKGSLEIPTRPFQRHKGAEYHTNSIVIEKGC